MNRRQLLLASGAAAIAATHAPRAAFSFENAIEPTAAKQATEQVAEPLPIESIRIVEIRGRRYCHVTSGKHSGLVEANSRVPALLSIFRELVNPFFLGKDAREIVSLVDRVYLAGRNYKYAGMPFWNPVANVELAVLDLWGRVTEQPAEAFFGKRLRSEVDVYISRFNRENSAHDEVRQVTRSLEKTGARATKLKIGKRLSNDAQQTKRDKEMIRLARETWGDDVTILVDANSSYTADEAIDMGRHLEQYNVAFFEEPCLWQDYRSTKQVADALDIPVAGGEQDNSLYQFRAMAADRIVDILQPDLYYNGGFLRLIRVAAIARLHNIDCTPHTPRTGPAAAPLLQAVSLVPNLGRFTEYREAEDVHDGKVQIPTAPGFGGATLASQRELTNAKEILRSSL